MTEVENNNIEEVETEESTENEEVDYKALYETEKEQKEKAEADSKKWKDRFKSNKAKENSTTTFDEETMKKMVDGSISTIEFYSENKAAKEHKEDIEALVAKGVERDKAYRYVLSEKDPTLLLDEQKRNQLKGWTNLTGTPADLEGKKDPYSMSEEEIAQLSDKEFDELFPEKQQYKRYHSE